MEKGKWVEPSAPTLSRDEILSFLTETDEHRRSVLFQRADAIRRKRVGEAVHLRGLIEISNHCRRNCLYCGVRAERTEIGRYRMSLDEILDSAAMAKQFGYGTVVLQAGEDAGLSDERIAETIAAIKEKFALAVTLSLGERPERVYRRWREAGADRYLMRFETSNPRLFEAIHPACDGLGVPKTAERVALLRKLREIGYEIGSGVMIGIPGQTPDDLADDLELFRALDLDMIGTGPYLPHPDTPLGVVALQWRRSPAPNGAEWQKIAEQTGFCYPIPPNQVESGNRLGFTVIALTRLLCPDANIPSTTAIATLDGALGRGTGLHSGANVIMPNLTPLKHRAMYDIYPNKAASLETAETTHATAMRQIAEAGRLPGTGPGGRNRQVLG